MGDDPTATGNIRTQHRAALVAVFSVPNMEHSGCSMSVCAPKSWKHQGYVPTRDRNGMNRKEGVSGGPERDVARTTSLQAQNPQECVPRTERHRDVRGGTASDPQQGLSWAHIRSLSSQCRLCPTSVVENWLGQRAWPG